ncbi:MAG: hypothetical protein EON56_00555 [Alphaproteobacteria bacterium]|nr:MAG: hypothetical protein EON56_00555 [Alphaproteobacteria bacterium]
MAESIRTVMDTWDIVKIALGSGATAALLGGGLQWVKEALFKKGDALKLAKIEAVHLITKLDLVALNCAKARWRFTDEMDYYRSFRWGSNDYPTCMKPDSGIEPSELAKIDQLIAARIAWLDNEYSLGLEMIRIKLEFSADPPDLEEALANLIGHYGYQALRAGEALRKKYAIPSEDLVLKMRGRVVESALQHSSDLVKKFLVSID